MNSLFIYLFQSGISITLLFLFYQLVLSRQSNFILNRFYLLGSLVFSMIIPLLQFNLPAGLAASKDIYKVTLPELALGNIPPQTPFLQMKEIVTGIYLLGVLVLLIRFGRQLFLIYKLRKNSVEIEKHPGFEIVKTSSPVQPFTFLRSVFISNTADLSPVSKNVIMEHELVHARQGHTFDLLLIELFIILQWFNPVLWFYKNSLRDIHEFLADQKAVRVARNISDYAQHILAQAMFTESFTITHHIFSSQIKKRVLMMNQKTSVRKSFVKACMVLPLACILFYTISCSDSDEKITPATTTPVAVETQKISQDETVEIADVMPVPEGGMQAFYKHISENLRLEKPVKSGKVFIEFTVNKDGQVQDAKVLKGIGEPFDSNALNAVKSFNNWEPGIKDGKPVPVKMVIPIAFEQAMSNVYKSISPKTTSIIGKTKRHNS